MERRFTETSSDGNTVKVHKFTRKANRAKLEAQAAALMPEHISNKKCSTFARRWRPVRQSGRKNLEYQW